MALKVRTELASGIGGQPYESVFDVTEFGVLGDGAHDDIGGLQEANDEISAGGGGVMFLPAGTYLTTSWLTVSSNVSLVGVGRASIIRAEFVSAKNRIITSSATEQQENIILRDFTVDRTHANSQHGVLLGGIKNLLIDGLYILGSSSPTVTSGALGVSPFDEFADLESENVRVVNCVVEKSNNFGIAFGYVTGGLVSNNLIFDAFREAIGIEGYDAEPSVSPSKGNDSITVSGNTIIVTENSNVFGGSVGPAALIGGATSGGYTRNVAFTGNTITGTETVASQGYVGVAVVGASVLATEDILIADNVIKNMNGRGIAVGAAGLLTTDVHITGNYIAHPNLGINSTPSGAAVGLRNASKCAVTGNHVVGSTHDYVVEETSGSDDNEIAGNTGDSGTVAYSVLTGASSYVARPSSLKSSGGVIHSENLTLADDATGTFTARGIVNRAFYFLTTNFGDSAQAIFTVNSTLAPVEVYVGSAVSTGSANPDTDAAVNIWPSSSTTISIKNRLGSSREFTLVSFATS